MTPTPVLTFDPIACIEEHEALEPCTPSRSEALGPGSLLRRAEQEARTALGDVPTLDLTDDLCDATTCRLAVDGVIVFSDRSHLSAAYKLSHVAEVRALLRALTA